MSETPVAPTAPVDADTTVNEAATVVDAEAAAGLLRDLAHAEVEVRTRRRILGCDYDDPGLRDFTASLALYVSLSGHDEDQLPGWYADDADIPADEDLRALLAKVSPLLADLAVDITAEDEGLRVTLVELSGSILDPYKLQGSLYHALDARSAEHEALYAALTANSTYGGIGLKRSLEDRVEGVGDVVLLTDVVSSARWEQVAEGLEAGLVSQVLQDVAVGSCAVLTHVGKLDGRSKQDKARRRYLEAFWGGASFAHWRHGIWYTSPGFRSFQVPADDVTFRVG